MLTNVKIYPSFKKCNYFYFFRIIIGRLTVILLRANSGIAGIDLKIRVSENACMF